MRLVLSVVVMLMARSAAAEPFSFPSSGEVVDFGLHPYLHQEPKGNQSDYTVLPQREYLGDSLADVIGMDINPPPPGSCTLVLIPSFTVTCISKK